MIDYDEMAKYRKKHFRVEVAKSRHDPNTITLSVTGNGKQWSVISFDNEDELRKVVGQIHLFLNRHGSFFMSERK